MNTASLRQLIDACFTAKRIAETLPQLPEGMKPRHIHVLDAVHEITATQNTCRVSDVSSYMRVTMPSITRLIQELQALHLVEKYQEPGDRRIILLRLTPEGHLCVKRYVLDFYREWAKAMGGVTNTQAREAAALIEQLGKAMPVG